VGNKGTVIEGPTSDRYFTHRLVSKGEATMNPGPLAKIVPIPVQLEKRFLKKLLIDLSINGRWDSECSEKSTHVF
jgi:hypothetical protein